MRITDPIILKAIQPAVNNVKYDSVNYRMQDSTTDLNKCKDEKLKLQAVVADLTQVNRRWQRYNNDMQIYIKKLQTTIEEQQEQINNIADFKAEQLLSSNKGRERDAVCWHCQPVINHLKLRISALETEVKYKLKENRKTDLESEVLSLQIRLRQTCDHIDHLNRLVNKGILKCGNNLLPETNRHKMALSCSLEDLKFYECDSENIKDSSESDIALKGIIASGIKTDNLSTDSDKIDKSHQKEELTKPSGSHSNIFSDKINDLKSENNFSNILKSENSTVFNIPHCSKTDNLINLKISENEECIDNNSINKEPTDIDLNNFKLINNNSRVWNITDILREGADRELLGMPMHITCPHCSTIFPPNSDDSFNKHIMSCQLL